MTASPIAVASQLWRGAPRWRATVMAAVFLTIGAVIYSRMVGDSARPSAVDDGTLTMRPRGAVPADPASDARLAAYESGYTEALKITNAAQRCEKLAPLFAALQDRDKARARHPAAPRQQTTAVVDGGRCANDIAASDSRWLALEKAMAEASRAQTGATLTQAVAAGRALNDFDRARARASAQAALLTRVAALTSELEASDKRINDVTEVAATLGKESTPANLARAAEAWQRLSDLDRNRLTPTQQTGVAPAREASTAIALSRGRLRRVEQAVAAVQQPNAPAPAQRQLIDALAAINDLDRLVATPEQKSAIQAAEQRAQSVGWSILEEAAGDLKKDATPDNYVRLASLLTVLRERLPAPRDTNQTEAMQTAQRAVATLAASDARLAGLLRADEMWRQDRANPATVKFVADSLRETNDFDQKRFGEAHRRAWEKLATAAMIIQGPELKPPLPKARLPILVTAKNASGFDSRLVNDINAALKQAGFVVAANESESAISMEVTAEKLSNPAADYSGTIVGFRVDAVIDVRAVWTVDSSAFLSAKGAGAARSTNAETGPLQLQALRNAIGDVVQRVQSRMDRGG